MDFSWVKQLAEEANIKEQKRQLDEHQRKETERLVSLATPPFVEKLHLLIMSCAEEFNKFIAYPHLKITTTRLVKRNKGTMNPQEPELAYVEECAFFSFGRLGWTYGIRGSGGNVEFVELPSSGSNLASGIEEAGVSPSHKMSAGIDEKSQQIVWTYNGKVMHGQDIVGLCQAYIREFIERTNQ